MFKIINKLIIITYTVFEEKKLKISIHVNLGMLKLITYFSPSPVHGKIQSQLRI